MATAVRVVSDRWLVSDQQEEGLERVGRQQNATGQGNQSGKGVM